jgi:hypothetical protein
LSQRIGTYLNHHVIIEADNATTQITFVPQPPVSDYFHVNDPPFTLEKARTLLASPALAPLQNGKVYAEAGGEKLYYRQLGRTTVEQEESILPVLANLARAYPKIVETLAGAAAALLQPLMADETHPLQSFSRQLLQDIGEATKAALGTYALDRLLCPRCLVYFGEHLLQESLLEKPLFFYGCRACGQSREFLEWTGQIIAVLSEEMAKAEVKEGDTLWVNWLQRRTLFDFEAVEIQQATDEAVERLAMQVGNDTDAIRRPRYPEMRCTVSTTCNLSENTLRILQRTFGEVALI